jgi:hypothetical protein
MGFRLLYISLVIFTVEPYLHIPRDGEEHSVFGSSDALTGISEARWLQEGILMNVGMQRRASGESGQVKLKPPSGEKGRAPLISQVCLQVSTRPKGCLQTIGDVNLLKNIIYMGLYRVVADAKLAGNMLIGRTRSDHGQDLYFSPGQDRFSSGYRQVTIVFFQEAFRHHPSGKPQFSVEHGTNAFRELFQGVSLIEKPSHPPIHGLFLDVRIMGDIEEAEKISLGYAISIGFHLKKTVEGISSKAIPKKKLISSDLLLFAFVNIGKGLHHKAACSNRLLQEGGHQGILQLHGADDVYGFIG